MQKVFICSPYRGDIEHNVKVAKDAGRIAAKTGYVPIIPHLVFPQFLNDDLPDERILGIKLGAELLKASDMMWLIGSKVTKGMKYELEIAKKMRIPIRCYDERLDRITLDTLSIDEQRRTILRDPSRDELAPHRPQEQQRKPKDRGRNR